MSVRTMAVLLTIGAALTFAAGNNIAALCFAAVAIHMTYDSFA